MTPFRGHKEMRAQRAPAGRCGALSRSTPIPGVKGGPMVGLGWLGLVEFDVDRLRSRATNGHSVNATRKTQNHAVARHKHRYIRPDEDQNDQDRALWAWARHTPPPAVTERASFFVLSAGGPTPAPQCRLSYHPRRRHGFVYFCILGRIRKYFMFPRPVSGGAPACSW